MRRQRGRNGSLRSQRLSAVGTKVLETLRRISYPLVARAIEILKNPARRLNTLSRLLRTERQYQTQFDARLRYPFEDISAELGRIAEEAAPAFEPLGSVFESSGLGVVIDEHGSEILEVLTVDALPPFEVELMKYVGFNRKILETMVETASRKHKEQLPGALVLLRRTPRILGDVPRLLGEAREGKPRPQHRLQRVLIRSLGKLLAGGWSIGVDIAAGQFLPTVAEPSAGTVAAAVGIAASITVGVAYATDGANEIVARAMR